MATACFGCVRGAGRGEGGRSGRGGRRQGGAGRACLLGPSRLLGPTRPSHLSPASAWPPLTHPLQAVSDQLLLISAAAAAPGGKPAGVPDHVTLRRRAAEHIRAHASEFAPFLPYEPGDGYPEGEHPDPAAVAAAVGRYCARMGGSSTWGGHPELRALSCVLGLPLQVFQAGAPSYTITPDAEGVDGGGRGAGGAGAGAGAPRRAGGGDDSEQLLGRGEQPGGGRSALFGDPSLRLRLSFHRSYYALGEHYNSVVAKGAGGA